MKCVICGRSAKQDRGNFNNNKTPLCGRERCKNLRKVWLQRARRASRRLGF